MMHYITYSNNTTALIAEIEVNPSLAHYVRVDEETGDKSIGSLIKCPTHRNGDETVSVVRNLPSDLQGLTHLTVLGSFYGPLPAGAPDENTQAWFADKFTDAAAQITYERVTDCMTPVVDDEGVAYVKPYIVGVC